MYHQYQYKHLHCRTCKFHCNDIIIENYNASTVQVTDSSCGGVSKQFVFAKMEYYYMTSQLSNFKPYFVSKQILPSTCVTSYRTRCSTATHATSTVMVKNLKIKMQVHRSHIAILASHIYQHQNHKPRHCYQHIHSLNCNGK